ncbi:MAG: hypothetical protein ACFB20_08300 [Opitutales bacterium]
MRKSSLKSLAALVAVGAVTLLSTGCTTFTAKDDYRFRSGEVNFLGIYKQEKKSFDEIDDTTLALYTDEIIPRFNPSGDRITLLWGLGTIADY